MGQAVIHDTLSLGILVQVPPTAEAAPLLKDVLFQAHKLDVNVQFEPIDIERYEQWVTNQGKDRYIITLLARKINAQDRKSTRLNSSHVAISYAVFYLNKKQH